MKKILFILLLSLPFAIIAQPKPQPIKAFSQDEVKDAKSEADEYFKVQGYTKAMKIYERLMVNDPNSVEYNNKLALCYLNTNVGKAKAVPLLEYVTNANSKNKPKDVLFDLGRAYFYAGMYDKALETYEKYREERKGSVDQKLKFNDWVNWATNAKSVTASPLDIKFENMGKAINSPSADYRVVMGASDSIIYFASKRKGSTGGLTDDLGDVTSDVYFFTQNDTSRSKAKNAGVNINTPYYEEPLFLTMTGDKLLTYREGPEANGDLYLSVIKGKQWDKPIVLGKEFTTRTMETGACMSPDGLTLYFSAQPEGSKTGKDIFKCTRTLSTGWSKPERLSDVINTAGDEDFPSMWLDGKTFFFSSTGHNSMGGYDIFRSILPSSSEAFSKPENLGYPINSLYDDQGIAVCADGKTAYITAVTDSGFGDMDIYKITSDKMLTNSQMVWIQGAAVTNAGGPGKGAFVVVTNAATGATVVECQTNDATGRFDIAVPSGSYKIALRHAKLGKAEGEFTADPSTASKQYLELKFP